MLRHVAFCFLSALSTLSLGCIAASGPVSDEGDGAKGNAVHDVEPLGADPQGRPTLYPIILEHGFNASPQLNGFYGVSDALAADGHVVYVTDAPPFRSADDRAVYLAAQIDQALANGATKVNIIGHSMGGLDAR